MSWLTDIKNKFLDDKGFFQRGKIAPLNKLGNKIRASVAPKPVVPNPYQPRQSFQQQSQPQFQSLPVLEPPKPTFKTEAASKLNARLDAIKRYGSSDPFAVKATKSPLPQPEFAQPVMEKILRPELIPQKLQLPDPVIKQPVNEFWNTKTGRGLVKAQEFTKPMADNMEQAVKTYKEDPTKIVTEGIPKLAKGLLVDTPKAMGRWAWNTGELLSGKKQQELDDLNREQEIKNKMMWNKLEVAKRYRESGNIEMANKVLDEVKRLNNSDSGKVYDDFIANNEVEKNQYIADAITTGMTVAGAGQPLNPKNLLAGGAISGTIGLVSGKDPFEAAGEGIANAQRWKAVTQFTNPAITKTINTFVNEKTAPVVSTVLTKLISGTGNVVEDRLIDKLEMKDRTIWNDVTSFVLGAVMGSADPKVGKWTKSDFSTATIKKQLADDLTKSGRLDPKDVETLNKVVDKIISIGINPDGSLKTMQGSTNIFTQLAPEPKVKTGEEPLIKKRTPEEITAIVENLRRQNYGDRQISQILKSEGIDTTNLNLKGDVTTIDGILKKKTFEPKPIRVKGTDINTEQLIREGWETDKIDYAIKLANQAKVTPDNAEAYVRGILKKQYPNQVSKMGRPLPPEPSAEEIARMDRNAGEQPIKTGGDELLNEARILDTSLVKEKQYKVGSKYKGNTITKVEPYLDDYQKIYTKGENSEGWSVVKNKGKEIKDLVSAELSKPEMKLVNTSDGQYLYGINSGKYVFKKIGSDTIIPKDSFDLSKVTSIGKIDNFDNFNTKINKLLTDKGNINANEFYGTKPNFVPIEPFTMKGTAQSEMIRNINKYLPDDRKIIAYGNVKNSTPSFITKDGNVIFTNGFYDENGFNIEYIGIENRNTGMGTLLIDSMKKYIKNEAPNKQISAIKSSPNHPFWKKVGFVDKNNDGMFNWKLDQSTQPITNKNNIEVKQPTLSDKYDIEAVKVFDKYKELVKQKESGLITEETFNAKTKNIHPNQIGRGMELSQSSPIKTGGEPKFSEDQLMERDAEFARPKTEKALSDMEKKFQELENSGYNPNPLIKTESKKVKVPTEPEIVNPRASSEVVKAKKTTVNEILEPKQAEIREHNEKEIKKLLEGGFEPKTKAEPNYKIRGFDARSRYSKVDVNTIKDQELRTKVRAVKNLEAWAADNKIKNAEGKIDSGWAEVAKVEEKIKMQKDNPVEMETIIRNVNTEEGIETVFEQRPKRKFVNDDYEAFDQKPPEGGKPPRKSFDPTKDKQKTEKVQLTDEEMAAKDADIKARLVKWAGKVKQGRSMATNQAKQFSEIPSTLRDEIINAREQTDVKPSAEAEKYAGKFGKVFDTLHKIATKYGINVEFRKDYFTHLWKTDADGNLIKNGRSVSSKPYFTRKQQLTWQEGLDMGLEPRFKTAQEALEAYSTALYKSIANKQLIDGLKKDGLAFDQQVGYQYEPVAIGGYRNELDGSNILYLPKKSAAMFEKVFNPKQAEAWWEKGFEATAKFGKGVTQTVLSGGYRAINAMGIGKLFFKELPSGNFNAFRRFGQAMTDSGAEKLYKDIEPDIKWLQGLGIDISAGKQNVSDYISNANYGRGLGETIKKAFKDNMESPTFDYFIPATQVDFARSIRKAGIKQGLSTDEVNKAVVDAMKQHYDVGNSLDSMLKNKNLNNFLDSVFFAKTLRKSTFMSNGVNTVKSLLDPTALKNRGNIKQVVGSVISLALLNEVNKASTGNNMWENPDGWQYAYIKYGKDKEGNDKYIRLNTTNIEYTWLTQGLKLIGSVGNGKKFASAAKAPLQFGIGQLVDLMSNTDYKMDKIWQGSDTGDVKAKKIADYLVTEFSHPIVKNVKAFLDKPDDEQKVEKLLGGLSESPISVKNSKTYSNAQYYKSVDDITSKLSEEDKKIYDSITKKQTEFGAKQRDKVADAQMLVNYPEVMKAQKEIAILNAKRTKTKLDPLYELSDEQLKTFYQIQGLGNNRAAQKDLKNANQWYSDLSEARSEHFKELIASGKMKEQENDYPQPSPETQKKLDYLKQLKTPEIKKKQDYYYTLPSGTGARKAYLNANPDLRKYWDTKNAFEDANPDIQEYWDEVNGYYVKVDEAFGILPTEEESGSSGGWQNWGNYKKKSDYEKLQDSLWNLKKKDRELSNKLSKKITDLLNEKPTSTKTKTIGSFFKSNKLSATRKIPLTGNLNRVKRKSYLYS